MGAYSVMGRTCSAEIVNVRSKTVKTIRIAVSSVTYAEKGRRVLAVNRIPARIVRLHAGESTKGCAFALLVTGDFDALYLRDLLTQAYVRVSEMITE